MVQTDDHKMRSECAMEFGKIQASLDFNREWRAEHTNLLTKLQLEIEKLTGNGHKGKIDDLNSHLQSIERLLTDQVARFDASQHRIERLEEFTEELESRIYTTSLKVAGAIGVVTVIAHYVMTAAGL